MKTLLIVTDAWHPQTNGVVTTLENVARALPAHGYAASIVHPGGFKTLPLPGYGEIRLARDPWRIGQDIERIRPQALHIATEGPLGLAARRYALRHGMAFTTSLHTKFPEYVHERVGLPVTLGYRFLRRFHAPAQATLCTTPSHRRELEALGFRGLRVWGRGVDIDRFRAMPASPSAGGRPRLLYVGRVAVEKNLEAFLDLKVDADKVVVGDGPARAALQQRYPLVNWLGYQHGDALVACYQRADVFVFPSRTDTFGLVMLEAMACGTPVAAYPVTGPKDVVQTGINGALHEDLEQAVRAALKVPRASTRQSAGAHSWQEVAGRLVRIIEQGQLNRQRPAA